MWAARHFGSRSLACHFNPTTTTTTTTTTTPSHALRSPFPSSPPFTSCIFMIVPPPHTHTHTPSPTGLPRQVLLPPYGLHEQTRVRRNPGAHPMVSRAHGGRVDTGAYVVYGGGQLFLVYNCVCVFSCPNICSPPKPLASATPFPPPPPPCPPGPLAHQACAGVCEQSAADAAHGPGPHTARR